jgi:N-acetylated-alpha-linked acidic dipeptidase
MPISTITDREGEQALLDEVRVDDAWALVERFSTLVRESGTSEELEAVDAVTERLAAWGVPFAVHKPELFISLPLGASLRVAGQTFHAKTPSMAPSTGPDGATAELVYEPASYARDVTDIFDSVSGSGDVTGKLVLTEGLPMPGRVADLASRGAAGVVCISPGERIHEGICTTIWGAPDLTSFARKPRIPVVSVSKSDGARLVALLQDGAQAATIVAEHDERWRAIPVVVAEIQGTIEPERFVLVHGHLDSWHVGVGDNATGDATLLEVARALHERRAGLARSVRIAWWSCHSHGRYAGSTWYADAHALDLERNCICHVNCDSPGCRDADTFVEQMWMAELGGFAGDAIADVTGLPSEGGPPSRAGDISFNNLGLSTCLMLSSTIAPEVREERGLYAVGGCGANIEWHTEADTIEVADRERLLRDIRLYAAVAYRAATSVVHPLDFAASLDQIAETLDARAGDIEAHVDLGPVHERIEQARAAIAALAARGVQAGDSIAAARPVNDALLRIGRELVSVMYAREGRYRQDPALGIPLLPDFAAALDAVGTVPDGVVRTELLRARNRLESALLSSIDAARR